MHVRVVAAVTAHWVLARGCGAVRRRGRQVCVDAVVAVVRGALRGVAEDLVGGRDSGEARGGGWVGAVAVWVVAEGEGVELSVEGFSVSFGFGLGF